MATVTQSNYIKFMTDSIAIVVMVVIGAFAAMNTGAFARFGHAIMTNGFFDHPVRLSSIGIPFVPSVNGLSIFRPIITAFVPIAIVIFARKLAVLAPFRFSFANRLSTLVFLVVLAFAVFATASASIQPVIAFSEFVKRLCFVASGALLGFHKNASCQLGVSTFA